MSPFVTVPETGGVDETLASVEDWMYVVVLDHAGAAVSLCTPDDLRRVAVPGSTISEVLVRLPAAVVVRAGRAGLSELMESESVTLVELAQHGVVVTGESGVDGVVPISDFDDCLADGIPPSKRLMGAETDGVLPGDILVPTARVRCAHPGCGAANALSFWDPDAVPWCTNRLGGERHLLVLGTSA